MLRVPSHIQKIEPYTPGKPLEELEREYGITDSVKLASNENPIGPSPLAVEAIRRAAAGLHRYPDGAAHDLTAALSDHLGVAKACILLGNGSDEIIGLLTRALLEPGDEAIIPCPSFLMYDIMVRAAGATPIFVPLTDLEIDLEAILARVTEKTRMVFLCNPNNPTGTTLTREAMTRFLDRVPPNLAVVVDEAYMEFVRDPDWASGIEFPLRDPAVVTLRTFSKAYGLAGLRIGYGVMDREIAELLNRIRPPFNSSSLAQAGAEAALRDRAFLEKTIATVHMGLDFLYDALSREGIRYFPSQANFFLIDVGQSADTVFDRMLREGIIVRSMSAYGYPEYIRINAGLAEENRRFVRALVKVLTPR